MSVVGCIQSEKYLSGICLVGEMSVRHLSGWENILRAFVWSGKCPSGMCLISEISIRNVSGRGSVHRGCVWSGKCPSGKSPSGMSPGIISSSLHIFITMIQLCSMFTQLSPHNILILLSAAFLHLRAAVQFTY